MFRVGVVGEGGTVPPAPIPCPPPPASFRATLERCLDAPQGLDRGPRIRGSAEGSAPGKPFLPPAAASVGEGASEPGRPATRPGLATDVRAPSRGRSPKLPSFPAIAERIAAGRLRIQLRVSGGRLMGTIRTERPEAKRLLRERLGELLEGLGALGLELGRWSVDPEPAPPPLRPRASRVDVRV
jgi:hypothetical protein